MKYYTSQQLEAAIKLTRGSDTPMEEIIDLIQIKTPDTHPFKIDFKGSLPINEVYEVLSVIKILSDVGYTPMHHERKDTATEVNIDITLMKVYRPSVHTYFSHDVSGMLCGKFDPDNRTTSATKCQFCGKEKWEH